MNAQLFAENTVVGADLVKAEPANGCIKNFDVRGTDLPRKAVNKRYLTRMQRTFAMTRSAVFLSRRTAVLGCAAVLLFAGVALQPVFARSGPFANMHGNWSGTGIIRVQGEDMRQNTERLRCSAAYRQRGDYAVNLMLVCRSDTYNLDLTGDFVADANDRISGQWTEHTRNVGGSIVGRARGSHLLVHAESPALNANLSMVTHRRSQSVSLRATGGGQRVSASIRLRRL